MLTEISIPDSLVEKVDLLARHTKKSRSQLFSDAVQEYVARHSPDDITEAMNRVCRQSEMDSDPFVSLAARRILEQSEW